MRSELEQELKELKKEEGQLSFIKDKSFSSEEEFNVFFDEHKPQFERLKNIRSKIREIKALLMTSEEKLSKEKELKKLKDKFSNDQI